MDPQFPMPVPRVVHIATALFSALTLVSWFVYRSQLSVKSVPSNVDQGASAQSSPEMVESEPEPQATAVQEVPGPTASFASDAVASAAEAATDITPEPLKRKSKSCLACGAQPSTLKRCSRCHQAFFCGQQCQLAAFRAGHKGDACPQAPKPPPDPQVVAQKELALEQRYAVLMAEGSALFQSSSARQAVEAAEKYRQGAEVAAQMLAGESSLARQVEATRMQGGRLRSICNQLCNQY